MRLDVYCGRDVSSVAHNRGLWICYPRPRICYPRQWVCYPQPRICYPLLIAAHEGHLTVVRTLCENGADLDKAKETGATPLFMAAQQGHSAAVRLLGGGWRHLDATQVEPVDP